MNEYVEFWINLTFAQKKEYINSLNLWEGFTGYKYQYLPNELKDLIKDKIDKS